MCDSVSYCEVFGCEYACVILSHIVRYLVGVVHSVQLLRYAVNEGSALEILTLIQVGLNLFF